MSFESYTPTDEEKTTAAIVHVIGVFGLVGLFINWFVLRDKSPYLAEHVRRSTNWLLSVLVVAMVCICTVWLIIPYFILLITGVANMVICILMAVKASNGEMVSYPLVPYEFIKAQGAIEGGD
jgi:uncharacterized Tic20 family protein